MSADGPPAVRLVLADDHVVLRQALKLLLDQRGYDVVGEASDGHTAVKLCQTLRPQIVILDLAMPLLNGIDAARQVVQASPDTKVILLTMHAEPQFVAAALRAGVSGYLIKSSAVTELVNAIEAVMAGEHYLSPSVSTVVVGSFRGQGATPQDPLSTREREVLQLIAEGKNMKEIGSMLGISARTAETHRARIMAKLAIHDVAGLVRYAIQTGLLHLDATDPHTARRQV